MEPSLGHRIEEKRPPLKCNGLTNDLLGGSCQNSYDLPVPQEEESMSLTVTNFTNVIKRIKGTHKKAVDSKWAQGFYLISRHGMRGCMKR